MNDFADRVRSLIEQPEHNLGDLLAELQTRASRPLPRPWSRLALLPEEEPKAPELWPEVAEALAPLVESSDSDLRLGSLQVLGLLPCPEATELLLRGLDDSLSVCRVAAIDGLASTPPTEEGVDRVLALLYDPQQPVRLHAAACLGPMGDARAAEPLRALLLERPDESSMVRQWAAFSLAELGGQIAVDALLEANLGGTDSLSLDLEIRAASRQVGQPLFDALEEKVRGGEPGVAEQASEALARLYDQGDDQAIQREAAELVAEGISALLGALKAKDGATMEDFISGLEAMENQFGGEAEGVPMEGLDDPFSFDEDF